MPKRLLKLVKNSLATKAASKPMQHAFGIEDIVWVMGSFCALNRKPFDVELLIKQFPPPYTSDSFVHAARALGFKIKRRDCNAGAVEKLNFPCMVVLKG